MYQQNSVRVLTELERIVLTGLNKSINQFNKQLNGFNIYVEPVDIHLVDRIKDRQLYPEDVNHLLRVLSEDHLCELIFDCEKVSKSFVQFTIQMDELIYVHGTYRKKEPRNLITFRTVIPYRIPYNVNDFLFKVNSK